ncbi:hypothetical protein [Nostoc sp.]|uniref:hypothetical protein n=1 Tax=Nostoc sp. TaxID=1180 RepID=UPI002FF5F64C
MFSASGWKCTSIAALPQVQEAAALPLGIPSHIMSDLILMSLQAERGNPKPLLTQLLETLREHSTSLHSQ